MANLSTNTASLEAILAKVNALPDAGSGEHNVTLRNVGDSSIAVEEADGTATTIGASESRTVAVTGDTQIDISCSSEHEDVTDETNAYTGLLTELETAVYELPEAGGTSVETCTVTVIAYSIPLVVIYLASTETGVDVVADTDSAAAEETATFTVVKGSTLYIVDKKDWVSGIAATTTGGVSVIGWVDYPDNFSLSNGVHSIYSVTGDGSIDFAP